MRDSWLTLIDSVLRPARPDLARCLEERERHLASRRAFAEGRARAIAGCEQRIELARAAVFAANDGVVPAQMLELEREWRRLSRSDPDAGVMDLWARIAPVAWIDRKRWRDSARAAQVDAAVALAADPQGVDAAEAAVASLRLVLVPWGITLGARVRFRECEREAEHTAALFAAPLQAAFEAVSAHGADTIVRERARHLERDVLEAACVRFPDRPLLAGDLAHAAFVDCVWRSSPLASRPNPVTPLRDLWQTGYVLAAHDDAGVTLEIPPL